MANTKSSLLEPMDIDTLDLLEVACQTTSFAFFFGDTCLGRLGPKNLRVIFSDTTGLGKFQTTNAQTVFSLTVRPSTGSSESSFVAGFENSEWTYYQKQAKAMDGRRDPFGILYLNESVMPSVEPSHDDVSMDPDYCGSSNDNGFSASGSTDSRSPFQGLYSTLSIFLVHMLILSSRNPYHHRLWSDLPTRMTYDQLLKILWTWCFSPFDFFL